MNKRIEDAIQSAVVVYLKSMYRKDIIFWSVPNEGSGGDPIRGAKLKRMGTQRGVADLHIFKNVDGETHILFLELKKTDGKQSPDQIMWGSAWGGWKNVQYSVAKGYNEAIEIIDNFLCCE